MNTHNSAPALLFVAVCSPHERGCRAIVLTSLGSNACSSAPERGHSPAEHADTSQVGREAGTLRG